MQELIELIKNNQSYLVKSILAYAKLYGYVKYTSTLEEAWVASISGLSAALMKAIQSDPKVPEIVVDNSIYSEIASFGIIEAKKHRQRGITLEMFLSLMKYYRQSYLDLIKESIKEGHQRELYLLWINRFFDHNEISYCAEWTAKSEESKLIELQTANRSLTNEKNKYLTIFESMSTPAIILDTDNRCINMNYEAQQLLQGKQQTPGKVYYSNLMEQPGLNEVLPWLYDEFHDFYESSKLESSIEKEYESKTQGTKNLLIRFHRMMDISGKFEGTVILFDDLTEYKKIEEQLRKLSFHDTLTGLYNRTYMAETIGRLATGRFNPVGFVSIDVDGLKLVNDSLGHHAGDNLLVTVSQIIKSCFREADIVVRNGGDEFSVIMFLSDAKTVKTVCNRLQSKIFEHNLNDPRKPVSISIGWSVGNMGVHCTINKIMKEADDRMYEDKQTKRAKYAEVFHQSLELYGQNMFQ